LNRLSFSTDLQERDVIFGGQTKLEAAIRELVEKYHPEAAFIYSTCIVGLIGDDVDAVCRKLTKELEIPVLSVHSEGFKGTKKDGYYAACQALFSLTGTGDTTGISPISINILGEFNLAGEAWIIKEYYRRMGVEVVSVMTGDGRVSDIKRSHGASLNVVQCSGSMTSLAKMMKEKYGIPFIRVSYFGIEDMAKALYDVAEFFSEQNPQVLLDTQKLVRSEMLELMPRLQDFRRKLEGRRAAIYVGGGFKAFSLVKALRHLGIKTVLVGSQTGAPDDYAALKALCDPGTVIVDDSNPRELSRYCRETQAELFIGGVKERPLALKLGMGFCDHNHERKIALAGFAGMYNFAKEVYASLISPVWKFARTGLAGGVVKAPAAGGGLAGARGGLSPLENPESEKVQEVDHA